MLTEAGREVEEAASRSNESAGPKAELGNPLNPPEPYAPTGPLFGGDRVP